MSAVASGLGAQICSTAQQAGVTALRCYDAKGLGYAAVLVFVLLIAVARVRSATLKPPSAAARGLRGRLRGVLRVAPL
jgi:hypothetical protein